MFEDIVELGESVLEACVERGCIESVCYGWRGCVRGEDWTERNHS